MIRSFFVGIAILGFASSPLMSTTIIDRPEMKESQSFLAPGISGLASRSASSHYFYERDHGIWMRDKGKLTLIDDGIQLVRSPNPDLIAYLKPETTDLDGPAHIMIYNKRSDHIERLVRGIGLQLAWSPDGRYLLIAADGPEITTYSVFFAVSGLKIMSFLGTNYRWIDDARIAYSAQFQTPSRPFGNGKSSGISMFDLVGKKHTVLLPPTRRYDYRMVDYRPPHMTVERTRYLAPNTARDPHEISYWTLDVTRPSIRLKKAEKPRALRTK